MLSDQQLLRYSRHILLDDIDVAGQQRLCQANVLIVGLGGLGSAAAMYLAAAGVGRLQLADDDAVELSNLQRQIAHSTVAIGSNKAVSAQTTLQALNPELVTQVIDQRLAGEALQQAVLQADVVLDCSDNTATRLALNNACIAAQRPLVSGAAIGWQGQIGVFCGHLPAQPCYQCLYPDPGDEALNCASSGVVAPLVGVIGSMQALEAIKLITCVGQLLQGVLLVFDAKHGHWQRLSLTPRPGCRACGGVNAA